MIFARKATIRLVSKEVVPAYGDCGPQLEQTAGDKRTWN